MNYELRTMNILPRLYLKTGETPVLRTDKKGMLPRDTSGTIISQVVNSFSTYPLKMARLKIVNNYDSSFVLAPEARENLFRLLTSETFLNQVAEQAQCQTVEFTELLFQPVPYTPATPKGMPAEFEQYHESDDCVIINVPPNFMFTAKIFQPSRLCAIYRKVASEVKSQESVEARSFSEDLPTSFLPSPD